MSYEAVIGLEVHCQLSTESKIFCGCQARLESGAASGELIPNSNVCPVCAGHPGALPVLNRKVVEYAIRAGLATGCEIAGQSVFARKNYFYADLPKGYQISQFDQPICLEGRLDVEIPGKGVKSVRIQRIHMEEDAGKNVHYSGYSVVDLNRAGVPLIEIVTHPDMSSPEEAGAYLRALHAIVTSIGICDGNMQNGNFRCDANVSVRPLGATQLGTRVEIKNVNSFRFIEKAIEFEIARQVEVLQAGSRLIQETRLYDSARNATYTMRTKEEAEDYRYFADPDLPPVLVSREWVERVRSALPELPQEKKKRYLTEFSLGEQDASFLTSATEWSNLFEDTLAICRKREGDLKKLAKLTANCISGEVSRLANDSDFSQMPSQFTPTHLADLVVLLAEQVISSTGGKVVIVEAWKTGDPVALIVERQGLKQVSDVSAFVPLVDALIAQTPQQVAEFKAGKEKILGFFVGQLMKQTGGKANPQVLQELIRKRLSS